MTETLVDLTEVEGAQRVGRVRASWTKIAWLYAMLLPALWWGPESLSWGTAAFAAGLGLLTLCLGHSVGLHRGIIHRTFQTSRWFRNVLVVLFILTGLGGPLSWLRLHVVRDHWQSQSDTPAYFGYAHGIWRDYLWNLHMQFEPARWSDYRIDPADSEDPFLLAMERTWPLIVLGFALLVGLTLGPEYVVVGVCGRVAMGILGHWFVGYVAHKFGYVRYHVEGASEHGRNTWLLGVLSFGEGFHNNHHAQPSSAAMGEAWWELDLGYAAIRAMEAVGLVWGVQSSRRANVAMKTGAALVPTRWEGHEGQPPRDPIAVRVAAP